MKQIILLRTASYESCENFPADGQAITSSLPDLVTGAQSVRMRRRDASIKSRCSQPGLLGPCLDPVNSFSTKLCIVKQPSRYDNEESQRSTRLSCCSGSFPPRTKNEPSTDALATRNKLTKLRIPKANIASAAAVCFSPISWDDPRVDLFGVAPDASIWHKFYTGYDWQPFHNFEYLPAAASSGPSCPSATTWGEGRLDVFYVSDNGGNVRHKCGQNPDNSFSYR